MASNTENNINIDEIYKNDFATFILSYKNPDNCKTLKTLHRFGFTGNYYLIVGTDDPKLEEYKVKHKDHVLIFDKSDYDESIDFMDQSGKRGIGVYARNACYDLAKQAGLKYFFVLDDDYHAIKYRVADEKNPKILRSYFCYQLDAVIKESLYFYVTHPEIQTLCWCQAGDVIGGTGNSKFKQRLIRKAMNSFFSAVDRPIKFFGRMNDDVNAYTYWGAKGQLFLTMMDIMIEPEETQAPNTGMNDIYQDSGTYRKTMYSIMHSPSFIRATMMGQSRYRLHHLVDWKCACPCIISSQYQKKRND